MDEALELMGQGVPLLVILLRLLVAAMIGGALGFERERMDKPAGLRTHMLVALGSATFVVLGFEVGAAVAPRYGDQGLDPTRVLQGVVGGLGFLGAGSIIQSRGQVSGVTTAATVWMAGALGAAAGMGAYTVALSATALSLLILMALRRLELRLKPSASPSDEDSDPDLRGEPTHRPPVSGSA
jgi:putative Mg2+ transporter-C (MgtC) family protein